ncbi:MAG: indolepyruvate oxidoreductase subunit beta [Candidatus Baldrarchaeia archaeon]
MIRELIREFNLLISAVGGQGGLTLSRVIANTAVKLGLKVRVGETLGMSQRGGAVVSFVRIGEDVYSPLIPEGGTDVLIGMEPIEALRAAKYVGSKTIAVVNLRPIKPVPVNLGLEEYPSIEKIIKLLDKLSGKVLGFDAYEVARRAGLTRAVNSVMLGAAVALKIIPLPREDILETLLETVPRGTEEMNEAAFKLGENIMKERALV